MTQFSDYARTVLFYEGDGDTPIYRYGGKAALAFLDGHVALVTPDQAKEVIWKPVFTAQ